MKHLFLSIFFLFGVFISFSQGKYAPDLKALIGKTFTDEKHIPGLDSFSFHEGTLITDLEDPEPQFLNVLLKENEGVVILSVMPDTSKKVYAIVDVIEVCNIRKGWEIRTAGCQDGEAQGQIIVALIRPGNGEFAKTVKKAWLCDRDKIRFKAISVKDIKCRNEGQD